MILIRMPYLKRKKMKHTIHKQKNKTRKRIKLFSINILTISLITYSIFNANCNNSTMSLSLDALKTASLTSQEPIPTVPQNIQAIPGNREINVSWQASTGAFLQSYTVTSNPNNHTCTASKFQTSCTVLNLASSTAYTFTVVANTNNSSSKPSSPSTPVTTNPTLPSIPLNFTATADRNILGRITLEWNPPVDNGGSDIINYTVTETPDGKTCSTFLNHRCEFTQMSIGKVHTFTLIAQNAVGNSAPIRKEEIPYGIGDHTIASTVGGRVYSVNRANIAIDTASQIIYAVPNVRCIISFNLNTGTSSALTLCNTISFTAANSIAGDGGLATSANFQWIRDITLDSSNNLYVLDIDGNQIRKITKSTNIISTVAGTSVATLADNSNSGDGGLATSATFSSPRAFTIDKVSGDIYVLDRGAANSVIRKITNSSGIITTIVGGGSTHYTSINNTIVNNLRDLNLAGIESISIYNNSIYLFGDNHIRSIDLTLNKVNVIVPNNLNYPEKATIFEDNTVIFNDSRNGYISRLNLNTQQYNVIVGNGSNTLPNGDLTGRKNPLSIALPKAPASRLGVTSFNNIVYIYVQGTTVSGGAVSLLLAGRID